MGKGGPLAFLNKKPWHPGNIQNQEEIWKREQAYLAEVEKREELKRQIEDEREAEDNATQFQREKLGEQRVEWMYQGGFAAQEDAAKKKEEYLMGKAVDKLPEHGPSEPAARVDELASGSMHSTAKQFSGNETWSRLNADPMLTMKRVEMDKVKNAQEKAKIARLQAQIQLKAAAKLAGKDLSSKKHKKDKKHKKEKKDKEKHKSKRKHRHEGSSDSGEDNRRRDRSPEERRNGDSMAVYTAHADRWHGDRKDRGDRNGNSRDRREMNGDGAHRDGRNGDRRNGDERHGDARDCDSRDRGRLERDRDEMRRGDRRDRDSRDGRDWDWGNGDRRDRDRADGGHGADGDRRDRDRRDRCLEDKQRADRYRGDRDRKEGDNSNTANMHKKEGYGLVKSHVPEYARQGRRDDTELTKRALDERVAAREREEREEAERAQAARRKYRPGTLTAEEKEQRRREMMGNAEDVQELRMGLLKRAHDEDMAAEKTEGRDTDEYLRSEERRMLLASSAVTTIGRKGR